MRVALTSAVYLGDVAPYLAIARRFAEAGHEAVVVAPEGFRSMAAGEPFEFRPYALDCSPAAMHADPEHERLLRHPFRNATRLGAYWVGRAFTDDVDAAVASLRAGLAGADVVVTHPTFAMASLPVARSLDLPVVVGHLFPMMLPTAEWGFPVGPWTPRLPGPLGRLPWWLLRQASAATMGDRATNRLRASLGQAPVRGNAGFAWTGADRTVLLASRHWYGDGAPDWPPATWGGFAVWDGPAGAAVPAEIDAHLDAGGPPAVLVTLGTSAATGAGDRFRAIHDGLAGAGLRPVVLTGGTIDVGSLAERPGVVPFAPVTAVLPRCAAAVTSGSLGSMAAALVAGVPQVTFPQLFDQVWNGRRLERLGVGIAVRRAADVAAAARRLVDDPAYAERARALAALLAGEDGAGAVVAAVEDLVAAG